MRYEIREGILTRRVLEVGGYNILYIYIRRRDGAKALSLLDHFGHFDVSIFDAEAQVFGPFDSLIFDSPIFDAEAQIFGCRYLMLTPRLLLSDPRC